MSLCWLWWMINPTRVGFTIFRSPAWLEKWWNMSSVSSFSIPKKWLFLSWFNSPRLESQEPALRIYSSTWFTSRRHPVYHRWPPAWKSSLSVLTSSSSKRSCSAFEVPFFWAMPLSWHRDRSRLAGNPGAMVQQNKDPHDVHVNIYLMW